MSAVLVDGVQYLGVRHGPIDVQHRQPIVAGRHRCVPVCWGEQESVRGAFQVHVTRNVIQDAVPQVSWQDKSSLLVNANGLW